MHAYMEKHGHTYKYKKKFYLIEISETSRNYSNFRKTENIFLYKCILNDYMTNYKNVKRMKFLIMCFAVFQKSLNNVGYQEKELKIDKRIYKWLLCAYFRRISILDL